MIPVLVTPPVDPVVTLDEMKVHLRVVDDSEDLLIQHYIDSAVAHFDGYSGVLGRAIARQTWRVSAAAAGDHLLPLPDVISAAGPDGALPLRRVAQGSMVSVSKACDVDFVCGLPAHLLPVVQQSVRLTVAHWFRQREAAAEGSQQSVPLSVEALIGSVRWVRF
ncbi:head-tail connector protein [Paracoccus sp. (in: a-proteobacteria)]|uniref:head-tail connector protein n=1 Tax=Paracoccus sp. TaxID=267 RepID=UPI00272AB4FF|nr:head-tail connector protein [Paracoccus sp. (in: a-proteobacteria)]